MTGPPAHRRRHQGKRGGPVATFTRWECLPAALERDGWCEMWILEGGAGWRTRKRALVAQEGRPLGEGVAAISQASPPETGGAVAESLQREFGRPWLFKGRNSRLFDFWYTDRAREQKPLEVPCQSGRERN